MVYEFPIEAMTGFLLTYLFSILTLTELVILRCLYIKYWSRLAAMSDYFIAMYLNLTNCLIIFLIGSILCISKQVETDVYVNFMEGLKVDKTFQFHTEIVFM